MYSAENYYWGLIGYYLGSVILILFICRFRKIVPGRHFRNLLVLFIAAVILVPIYAYPDSSFLAPAWFVSIFESMTAEVEQAYMRGVKPILICYVVAVCFYVIWAIFDYRRNQTRVVEKPATTTSK
tara:strand:- start:52 stop:429 length:378 start_codon:yes stop_codon:yes gene_type:complete